MARNLTAAEAWCWASHLLSKEALELEYEWPRKADSLDRAEELEREARALRDRAAQLDPSKGLWRRALKKFDTPVKLPRKSRRTTPVSAPEALETACKLLKEGDNA